MDFFKLLLWATSLLCSISALSLNTTSTTVHHSSFGTTPNLVTPADLQDFSLQIIFEQTHPSSDPKVVAWQMWQGPRGTAVNYCGDNRFKRVYRQTFIYMNANINNPPFTGEKEVQHRYKLEVGPYKNCAYVADGISPGLIECGNFLVMDCKNDAQRGDATGQCSRDKSSPKYHRAYSCE